jgi:dCMP deaminase
MGLISVTICELGTTHASTSCRCPATHPVQYKKIKCSTPFECALKDIIIDDTMKLDSKLWMRRAYLNALSSSDPSTQNGAVLVKDNMVLADGYNRFPTGVHMTGARLERPLKYSFMEHAERMAIYTAAADGHNTAGSTLYCLWASCDDCARGIIAAGITEVVTHSFYDSHRGGINAKDWDAALLLSKEMWREAGVKFTLVDMTIMEPGDSGLLFNGTLVSY